MMTNSLQRILTMHNSNANIPFKLLIIKMLTMVTHFNSGSFKQRSTYFVLNTHIFIFFISKRSSAVYTNLFSQFHLAYQISYQYYFSNGYYLFITVGYLYIAQQSIFKQWQQVASVLNKHFRHIAYCSRSMVICLSEINYSLLTSSL